VALIRKQWFDDDRPLLYKPDKPDGNALPPCQVDDSSIGNNSIWSLSNHLILTHSEAEKI